MMKENVVFGVLALLLVGCTPTAQTPASGTKASVSGSDATPSSNLPSSSAASVVTLNTATTPSQLIANSLISDGNLLTRSMKSGDVRLQKVNHFLQQIPKITEEKTAEVLIAAKAIIGCTQAETLTKCRSLFNLPLTGTEASPQTVLSSALYAPTKTQVALYLSKLDEYGKKVSPLSTEGTLAAKSFLVTELYRFKEQRKSYMRAIISLTAADLAFKFAEVIKENEKFLASNIASTIDTEIFWQNIAVAKAVETSEKLSAAATQSAIASQSTVNVAEATSLAEDAARAAAAAMEAAKVAAAEQAAQAEAAARAAQEAAQAAAAALEAAKLTASGSYKVCQTSASTTLNIGGTKIYQFPNPMDSTLFYPQSAKSPAASAANCRAACGQLKANSWLFTNNVCSCGSSEPQDCSAFGCKAMTSGACTVSATQDAAIAQVDLAYLDVNSALYTQKIVDKSPNTFQSVGCSGSSQICAFVCNRYDGDEFNCQNTNPNGCYDYTKAGDSITLKNVYLWASGFKSGDVKLASSSSEYKASGIAAGTPATTIIRLAKNDSDCRNFRFIDPALAKPSMVVPLRGQPVTLYGMAQWYRPSDFEGADYNTVMEAKRTRAQNMIDKECAMFNVDCTRND